MGLNYMNLCIGKPGLTRFFRRLPWMVLLLSSLHIQIGLAQPAKTAPGFLPVDQAFIFSGELQNGIATITALSAKNYYLYKDRIHFSVMDKNTIIKEPEFPAGIEIFDAFQRKKMNILNGGVKISIPYVSTEQSPGILVNFQGCAKAGLCYPPAVAKVSLKHEQALLTGSGLNGSRLNENINNKFIDKKPETAFKRVAATATAKTYTTATKTDTDTDATPENQNHYFKLLSQYNSLLMVLSLFFAAGFMLAFTPCVLPMIPILSATLASSTGNRRRTIILTAVYVLFMSVTYAIAGSLVGLFGATLNLQALLQSPWAISLFALLFVALALSMFGAYELQLPAWLRQRIMSTDASVAKKRQGSISGAAFMGTFSALVVSPCITAPLVGALLYISSTQDAVLGGLALFSLGLGMGIPLLLFGIGMGQFLPKSGSWMENIKYFFGFLMLGIAAWLLARLIPAHISLMLFGAIIISLGLYICQFLQTKDISVPSAKKLITATLACLFIIYGACLIIGGLMGNGNLTTPLSVNRIVANMPSEEAKFITVTDPQRLHDLQRESRRNGKPVLLEFYADWCESCKHMDETVFKQTSMGPLLSNFTLIRFDITKTMKPNTDMMSTMNVFGTPTIMLYDKAGAEKKRMTGIVTPNNFKQILADFLKNNS